MSTKVGATALGTMLSTILVWAVKQWAGIDVPDPVVLAIGGVLGFLLGYVVPEQNPAPSMVAAVRAGKGAAK